MSSKIINESLDTRKKRLQEQRNKILAKKRA